MEGCLTHIKTYQSHTQTTWGGTTYKCVFKVVIDNKLQDGWSLQISPKMRNYKNWKQMIDNKLLAPSKWIMMGKLKVRSLADKTLEADYFVGEDKPNIIEIINKPKKKVKKPKASNQFNELFKKT